MTTASSDSYLEEDTFYDPSSGDERQEEKESRLTPEERAKLQEQWWAELSKTEEEIVTLRQVLSSKLRRAHELKQKLGVTVWGEMREDLRKGVAHIREMPSYQKTTAVVKTAKDKTSTKWQAFRNSNLMKSFEGKMGNAYTTVKKSQSMGRLKGRVLGSGTATTPSEEAPADGVMDGAAGDLGGASQSAPESPTS